VFVSNFSRYEDLPVPRRPLPTDATSGYLSRTFFFSLHPVNVLIAHIARSVGPLAESPSAPAKRRASRSLQFESGNRRRRSGLPSPSPYSHRRRGGGKKERLCGSMLGSRRTFQGFFGPISQRAGFSPLGEEFAVGRSCFWICRRKFSARLWPIGLNARRGRFAPSSQFSGRTGRPFATGCLKGKPLKM